jgi:hypothetical protein
VQRISRVTAMALPRVRRMDVQVMDVLAHPAEIHDEVERG